MFCTACLLNAESVTEETRDAALNAKLYFSLFSPPGNQDGSIHYERWLNLPGTTATCSLQHTQI